jgi:hypothetical protein
MFTVIFGTTIFIGDMMQVFLGIMIIIVVLVYIFIRQGTWRTLTTTDINHIGTTATTIVGTIVGIEAP